MGGKHKYPTFIVMHTKQLTFIIPFAALRKFRWRGSRSDCCPILNLQNHLIITIFWSKPSENLKCFSQYLNSERKSLFFISKSPKVNRSNENNKRGPFWTIYFIKKISVAFPEFCKIIPITDNGACVSKGRLRSIYGITLVLDAFIYYAKSKARQFCY